MTLEKGCIILALKREGCWGKERKRRGRMEKRLSYRILQSDLPATAEQILKKRLGLSKQEIRRAKFRQDGICLDGRRIRVTAPLLAGEVLEVVLEAERREQRLAEKLEPFSGEESHGRLEILYEDEDLLLINKPSGLAAHPGHGHYRDTLANQLAEYFQGRAAVRSIGRLDLETSGIMVFGKSQAAAARLWEKGSVKKEYYALARGRFRYPEGSIYLPIRKRPGSLNQMEISLEGQEAVTHYRLLETYGHGSLLALQLETGRTHQIRLHMAAVGHPLYGDRPYGGWQEITGCRSKDVIQRSALHCGRVWVRQPFTGQLLEQAAPLPEDMVRLIKALSGIGET